MRILTVLFSIVIAASCISDYEQWLSFKNLYGKTYSSNKEEAVRFRTFRKNLRKIESHNAGYETGETTYKMGVNQFTDLDPDDFSNRPLLPKFIPEGRINAFFAMYENNAETSVDWRDKGAVLDVQKQGECYSEWAFSALGALEGQNAIKHNQKIILSPQELIDCSRLYGNFGCGCGWVKFAFNYVIDKGISAAIDYPYDFAEHLCNNLTEIPRVPLNVTSYTLVDANEEALRQAVEKIGPISVTIFGDYIKTYENGIFQHENCPSDKPTHALLAVGYGTENGTDYWILKNSFGKRWGENGYIRMVRNKNNTCGIASNAMYPNIL